MTRDLRKYTHQTNIRLIVGGLLILFVVGGGLIWLFYGQKAALLGVVCMLLGLSPIVIIWFIFVVLEWIVKKSNNNE
jgi:hypothetical protein